jgi:hypothetical protein
MQTLSPTRSVSAFASRKNIGTAAVRFWSRLMLCIVGLAVLPANAADQDGIALAVVYDTSGSMAESVRDQGNKPSPKYVIANRALTAIINRLENVATNAASGTPKKIEAGLFIFKGEGATTAVPFGTFDPKALRDWTKNFTKPSGATPLGEAVRAATQAVLKSKFSHRHVLVLTDGMNTAGPDPARVIPQLRNEAAKGGVSFDIHFVAFDVAAGVFAPVKKLGATVVGAADELQLNTQLSFILEAKILLEAEEPVKPAK